VHVSAARANQRLEKNCHILNLQKKSENKSCRVTVDSGSCINTVASKLIITLGMKPVKHSSPYKVTWIDATSIEVQERCQIPI